MFLDDKNTSPLREQTRILFAFWAFSCLVVLREVLIDRVFGDVGAIDDAHYLISIQHRCLLQVII